MTGYECDLAGPGVLTPARSSEGRKVREERVRSQHFPGPPVEDWGLKSDLQQFVFLDSNSGFSASECRGIQPWVYRALRYL